MVARLQHGRPAEASGHLMVRHRSVTYGPAFVSVSGAVFNISGSMLAPPMVCIDLLGSKIHFARRGPRFILKITSRSRDVVYLSFSKEELMGRWCDELKNASSRQIEKHYTLSEVLGGGQYSRVVAGCDKRFPTRKVAVKIIDKLACSGTDSLFAKREYNVMRRSLSPHPNIIDTLDVYETLEFLYIVISMAAYGSLRDYLDTAPKGIPETRVVSLARSISRGLYDIHSKGLVHRDVKLENILMLEPTGFTKVKIADFGYAVGIQYGGSLSAMVGTPGYFPPEMLRKELYSFPADMWSFGVCLYQCLTGQYPFGHNVPYDRANSHITKEVLRDARDGLFRQNTLAWNSLSLPAQSLIRSLLITNPHKRLCALGVLAHPWLGGLCNFKPRRPTSMRAIAQSALAVIKLVGYPLLSRMQSNSSDHGRNETSAMRYRKLHTSHRRRSIGWPNSSPPMPSADECGRRLRDSLSDDTDLDDGAPHSSESKLSFRRSFGSIRTSHDSFMYRRRSSFGSLRDMREIRKDMATASRKASVSGPLDGKRFRRNRLRMTRA